MYEGAGTFKGLVAEASKAMGAVRAAQVKLPPSSPGIAKLYINGVGKTARLTLDLEDAAIFSLENVVWRTRAGATITRNTAKISGSSLIIEYTAT